jgi:hypothetical protein
MDVSTLLTDPRSFFAARRDDPSLRGPTLVVATHALTSLATAAVLLSAFTDFPGAIDTRSLVYVAGAQRVSAPQELVLSLAMTGVLSFALWVVVAAIVYGVSAYFDGSGAFRRVLAFVGWGLVPTLIPTVAANALTASLFLGAPTFESPAVVESWALANVQGHPLRRVIELVRPVFTLWMLSLWILAAECARDLTRRQAVVAVALPGVVALVNVVGTYAGVVAAALG